MKRSIFFLALFVAIPALAQQPAEIRYQADPNFLKLPPDTHLGEAVGVAVNSKGHIFVFSRGNSTGPAYGASAAQLLQFLPDGRFVREIGHNLYAWSFAHSVRIDKDDNIWVADKGSDMVVKFNPEGRVVMVFGRKQEASDEGTEPLKHPKPPLPPVDGMFRQVTDMAWDSAGNTYISDGYVNSRIAKADKNGVWLKSWGEPGDKPGQFNIPHSIAVDAQNNVYVADRSNRRIQVFDPLPRTRAPPSAPSPPQTPALWPPGSRGLCASRPARIKSSTLPTPTPVASTNSPSTEKFSACSAKPASSPASSAGSIPSPAPRKTNSTSPKSSTGGYRNWSSNPLTKKPSWGTGSLDTLFSWV